MLSLTLVVWRLTILMSDFTDFVQFLIEGAGDRPAAIELSECPTLPPCLWSDTSICPSSLNWQTGHNCLPIVCICYVTPLHQGQLRSMVGFPSTWLEINPSRLDFQPLVRNPTAGWYSTHWMVRIPTILPLCIKYRNLSRAPQIVETLKMWVK